MCSELSWMAIRSTMALDTLPTRTSNRTHGTHILDLILLYCYNPREKLNPNAIPYPRQHTRHQMQRTQTQTNKPHGKHLWDVSKRTLPAFSPQTHNAPPRTTTSKPKPKQN
jgi:hypothetical protein